jgi:sortase A
MLVSAAARGLSIRMGTTTHDGRRRDAAPVASHLRQMLEFEVGQEVVVETARWIENYDLDTADACLADAVHARLGGRRCATPPTPPGASHLTRGSGQRLITLTTCAALLHAEYRLIAFGHLVE